MRPEDVNISIMHANVPESHRKHIVDVYDRCRESIQSSIQESLDLERFVKLEWRRDVEIETRSRMHDPRVKQTFFLTTQRHGQMRQFAFGMDDETQDRVEKKLQEALDAVHSERCEHIQHYIS